MILSLTLSILWYRIWHFLNFLSILYHLWHLLHSDIILYSFYSIISPLTHATFWYNFLLFLHYNIFDTFYILILHYGIIFDSFYLLFFLHSLSTFWYPWIFLHSDIILDFSSILRCHLWSFLHSDIILGLFNVYLSYLELFCISSPFILTRDQTQITFLFHPLLILMMMTGCQLILLSCLKMQWVISSSNFSSTKTEHPNLKTRFSMASIFQQS